MGIQLVEISPATRDFVARCARDCEPVFEKLFEVERQNTRKVLAALQRRRVSARHFAPTTGYGYDDIGREALCEIFADVMGCEAALVRPQIASGTHALALCLQGVLRPGDVLVSATGAPYDTMRQVIGTEGTPGQGSLLEYGIEYRQVELEDGRIDVPAVLAQMDDAARLVLIQRSRGYDWRRSLSVAEIDEAARAIRAARPNAWVMVDNCYGEFTQTSEPAADLIAGSLIKNPGGGLAPTGGYIAGRKEAVELVGYRLTSPGIGAEVGSYAGGYLPFYQGLFLAPHVTMQAVKTAVLAARVFAKLGYEVHPAYDAPRGDIIEAIKFGEPDRLIAFVRSIQKASPVDSEAIPEPWAMPGYEDEVIMAAGTFVAGASIELSADAPIRTPYIGYLQGGLTYAHGYTAIESAVEALK
ncbi:MAG: methionine gamma-lyase family protein [Christensenellaceae bacterium]|nr:methionine gamma-lyase family protein [Christensenellaceae bacterium]